MSHDNSTVTSKFTHSARGIFIDFQKYGGEVKADTMLYGVNTGDVRTTHRESSTDPIHVLPTDSPSSACPPVRLHIYFIAYERAICFLALLIVDGRSECPLGTLSLLTCDYAAGLVLYSLHVLMSMCHFCSSSCRSWTPFPP